MASPVNPLEVFTSGEQEKVDVRALETELVRIWKSASEAGESGRIQPVTRAAVLTLVAIVEGDAAAVTMTAWIARLTEHAPCRALLVNLSGGEQDPPFSAWVSAHCHRVSGGRQVCCEQVTIASSPSGYARLAGLIVPLLIPDLPVFVYWPGLLAGKAAADAPGGGVAFLDQLADNTDYIVVDSAVAADPARAVAWMAGVIREAGLHEEPRDLNWSRLLPWREALADLFEPVEMRPWLAGVRSIDVEACAGPELAPDCAGCPVRPLLFGVWLAGRLGWKRAGARRTDGRYDISFDAGRAVTIVLKAGEEIRGRISRVTIRFSGERAVEVARPSESGFEAVIRQNGQPPVTKNLPRHVQSEEDLLCGELDRRGAEPVFRAAILDTADLLAEMDGKAGAERQPPPAAQPGGRR